uniref:Uncharacterized protein n=1 Tax=Arundo donax TaxID=35708 RepID=A0A0A8YC59_ARUDO
MSRRLWRVTARWTAAVIWASSAMLQWAYVVTVSVEQIREG